MEKGTTSYILRGIPFCLWVAFTSFRKTWHKGQLLEDRGTEMTARGIQVKQKDSSVRGVIFRDLTWLAGSICWSQIVMILLLGQEHEHGKTQYIPGKQVLVRSWLWKTNKLYIDLTLCSCKVKPCSIQHLHCAALLVKNTPLFAIKYNHVLGCFGREMSTKSHWWAVVDKWVS